MTLAQTDFLPAGIRPSPQTAVSALPQVTARRRARGALSARELEVLQLIAQGRSNKQVAHALGLSPHTVKRHVANVLTKLGLESRGRAAAWYYAQTATRST